MIGLIKPTRLRGIRGQLVDIIGYNDAKQKKKHFENIGKFHGFRTGLKLKKKSFKRTHQNRRQVA